MELFVTDFSYLGQGDWACLTDSTSSILEIVDRSLNSPEKCGVINEMQWKCFAYGIKKRHLLQKKKANVYCGKS